MSKRLSTLLRINKRESWAMMVQDALLGTPEPSKWVPVRYFQILSNLWQLLLITLN